MAIVTAIETTTGTSVGMGQMALGRGPARLSAVLGSCIGLTLHHARTKLGVMAHVVLPESSGRPAAPGKFADTAVPHAIEMLAGHGAAVTALRAKIVGGAAMFGAGGPLRIGEANSEAIRDALQAVGIPIVTDDLGGTSGRRISFDCNTGQLLVEQVGCPPRTL